MKHVIPFFVDLPKEENYFELGKNIADGEIIQVKGNSIFKILSSIFNENTHAHGRGFPFPELCGLFSKKSVYTPHSNTIGQNWITKIIRRFEFSFYDKIIVSTEFAKKNLVRDGIKPDKVVVIPNSINYKFFSKPEGGKKFREKFNIGKDEPLAICVGIWWVKNPKVIIDACELADVKLVMIGDTESKHVNKKFQFTLPPKDIRLNNKVILTGHLSHKELLSALSAATIFINSSEYENFGIAVYEAAAAGVTLCLPKIGVFDIFKKSALFHEKTNSKQLAENIKKYVSSPKLRKRNSKLSKNISKKFDYPIIKKEMEKLYKEVGFI